MAGSPLIRSRQDSRSPFRLCALHGPRLEDLRGRVHRGAYRPRPSRRAYIPKADGKQRPLAIAALEDKIVQGATVMLLNVIYEGDFRGFSYGFRPGRGPHDALDALSRAIKIRKVNWILDADIQNFFGAISQDWLVRYLEHRILGRTSPALRPVRALLVRVSLGPRPWLRQLRRRSPGSVRRLHCYYAGVRLLWVVHQRLRLLTFPLRTMRPQQRLWPIQRSPGSRARSVRTCQGLRPRRVWRALAMTHPPVLPSVE